MAGGKEFSAYPPQHQKRSLLSSGFVRVIFGLIALFMVVQLFLYRMALKSVHAMDYSTHVHTDDLDLVSDLRRRAKDAYDNLVF
mmetsp:Transcript_29608/g.79493  ORF Transcript_29608/g.79493 Transcript_29608/m.79493 type:complete len:84 (-) Transcript_29608:351-602(-)